MKEVELTQNKVAIVDDEDFERVSKYKWHYNNGYCSRTLKKKELPMHWEIMGKPEKGFEIDHSNGDKLDNRKNNLRVCTRSENNRNVGIKSTNKSGRKGVCWNKDRQKWQAYITVNYKQIHLGMFENKEDAARAYNVAATKYHKEYAKLN